MTPGPNVPLESPKHLVLMCGCGLRAVSLEALLCVGAARARTGKYVCALCAGAISTAQQLFGKATCDSVDYARISAGEPLRDWDSIKIEYAKPLADVVVGTLGDYNDIPPKIFPGSKLVVLHAINTQPYLKCRVTSLGGKHYTLWAPVTALLAARIRSMPLAEACGMGWLGYVGTTAYDLVTVSRDFAAISDNISLRA